MEVYYFSFLFDIDLGLSIDATMDIILSKILFRNLYIYIYIYIIVHFYIKIKFKNENIVKARFLCYIILLLFMD